MSNTHTIFKTYKYDLYNSQTQVLHEMKRQGHVGMAAAWLEAGLTWTEFLPATTEVAILDF